MKTDWQKKRTESLAWLRAHGYTFKIAPFTWVRDCWPDVSEYKDAWVAGAQTETCPTPKAALAEWLRSERRSISERIANLNTELRENVRMTVELMTAQDTGEDDIERARRLPEATTMKTNEEGGTP